MKRADQVLPERVVDADLAADGAVDLREQGGRHVHQVYPAQVRRGREPDGVADDPAAHRDDRRLAVGAALDQGFVKAGDRLQRL